VFLDLGETVGSQNRRLALLAAAENGHVDIVEMLLQRGADVNAAAPSGGWTALQGAAKREHGAIVDILLQR